MSKKKNKKTIEFDSDSRIEFSADDFSDPSAIMNFLDKLDAKGKNIDKKDVHNDFLDSLAYAIESQENMNNVDTKPMEVPVHYDESIPLGNDEYQTEPSKRRIRRIHNESESDGIEDENKNDFDVNPDSSSNKVVSENKRSNMYIYPIIDIDSLYRYSIKDKTGTVYTSPFISDEGYDDGKLIGLRNEVRGISNFLISFIIASSTPIAVYSIEDFILKFGKVTSFDDRKYMFIMLNENEEIKSNYIACYYISDDTSDVWKEIVDKSFELNGVKTTLLNLCDLLDTAANQYEFKKILENKRLFELFKNSEYNEDEYFLNEFLNDIGTVIDESSKSISFDDVEDNCIIYESRFDFYNSFRNGIIRIKDSIGLTESDDEDDGGALNDDEPFLDDASERESEEIEQKEEETEELEEVRYDDSSINGESEIEEEIEQKEEEEEIGMDSVNIDDDNIDEIDPDDFSFDDGDDNMVVNVIK